MKLAHRCSRPVDHLVLGKWPCDDLSRAAAGACAARGHDVLFLERDVPWYAADRDLPDPPFWPAGSTASRGPRALRHAIASADAVIVGSFVPDGVAVGALVQREARGATAFYDIDTPVTLAKLARGDHEYLSPASSRGYRPLPVVHWRADPGATRAAIRRADGTRAVLLGGSRADYRRSTARTLGPQLPWHLQPRSPAAAGTPAAGAGAAPPQLRFAVAGPQYPDDNRLAGECRAAGAYPACRHRAFYTASASR